MWLSFIRRSRMAIDTKCAVSRLSLATSAARQVSRVARIECNGFSNSVTGSFHACETKSKQFDRATRFPICEMRVVSKWRDNFYFSEDWPSKFIFRYNRTHNDRFDTRTVAQFKNNDSLCRENEAISKPNNVCDDPKPSGNCPAPLKRFPATSTPAYFKKPCNNRR
jgi:hypothetical protein